MIALEDVTGDDDSDDLSPGLDPGSKNLFHTMCHTQAVKTSITFLLSMINIWLLNKLLGVHNKNVSKAMTKYVNNPTPFKICLPQIKVFAPIVSVFNPKIIRIRLKIFLNRIKYYFILKLKGTFNFSYKEKIL